MYEKIFIKLTLRAKVGYHHSDPNANTEVRVSVSKIDYYYDTNDHEGYESIISINGHEFKCRQNAAEIAEKIELA